MGQSVGQEKDKDKDKDKPVVTKASIPKLPDGTPFLWDYQIRGFFKEICGAMRGIDGTKSSKVKAYKKKVDNTVFVEPREIPLDLHGMQMDNCQRPLRAQTMQGERIALANSEVCPEGTSCEFTVVCMIDSDVDLVREWLEYGRHKGIGQWRNSGKGRFTFEEIT